MSSDSTGEIYVVTRAEGGSANEASPSSGIQSPTGTGAAASPTRSPGAAMKEFGKVGQFAAVLAGIMALPFV